MILYKIGMIILKAKANSFYVYKCNIYQNIFEGIAIER